MLTKSEVAYGVMQRLTTSTPSSRMPGVARCETRRRAHAERSSPSHERARCPATGEADRLARQLHVRQRAKVALRHVGAVTAGESARLRDERTRKRHHHRDGNVRHRLVAHAGTFTTPMPISPWRAAKSQVGCSRCPFHRSI